MLRVIVLCCIVGVAFCDTIANCTYEDAVGKWSFGESTRNGDSSIDCSSWNGNATSTTFKLEYPNVVFDSDGNRGTWTLIYNQGFEININFRKYFVYFWYDAKTYDCSKTMPGWSHDVTIRNWACTQGTKNERLPPREVKQLLGREHLSRPFKNDHVFVERITAHQNSWEATVYPHFEKMTHGEMLRMRGGLKSRIPNRPTPAPSSFKTKKLAEQLPESFDWRNVNGVNYVSPVRNQGTCGSCYSFSSMGMLEARVRVASKNREQPVFSPQDVVSCSAFSQGCEGGFPYLIAGKYAQDYGVVAEECNPYIGTDTPSCNTMKNCSRTYSAVYQYVGGYYGACNEDLMKIALVKNGPMSVSFEVYPDFQQYKGGIYHHTGLTSDFSPFELTNHAVLLVGYGADAKTGEKYWIVKNSWGTQWGENGFFRIRRGTDECAIESIAVESFPIV